jgi:hypothetical protein
MEQNPMIDGVQRPIPTAFARCVMPNAPASPTHMPVGGGGCLAGIKSDGESGRLRFKDVPVLPAGDALARGVEE